MHDTGAIWRRQLTPAEHAAIRAQLFLIPVYVWIVFAWSIFLLHLPVGPFANSKFVFRDFVHFYAQGVITREHDWYALYDIDAMGAVVDRISPVPTEARFPPVYGPQVGLLFAPMAYISYVPAMVGWLVLTIVGYLACVYALWRSSKTLRRKRWLTAVLALGAAGLHFTLSFAQISLVGLVCFTVLWLALRAERPFIAGLAVGALAYKPQLGVVAAFVFVGAAEWRVVTGAVSSIAVQAAASLAYWGPSIFVGYLRALARLPNVIEGMEPDKELMHSWRSMLLQIGLPASPALVVSVLLSVLTIAGAVVVWRTRGALAARYVTLVMATLLVDPHIYAYDLMILVPALLVAWDWANTQGLPVRPLRVPDSLGERVRRLRFNEALVMLTAFVYFAPLITLAIPVVPLQWSVVGFVGLGAACALKLVSNKELTLRYIRQSFKRQT